MNKNQKIALLLTGAAILVMLLFPPFQVIFSGTTINMGYGFIFTPPKKGYLIASVNSVMLFVQWIGVVVIGSLAFFLLKNTGETSSKKMERKINIQATAIPQKDTEEIFSNKEEKKTYIDKTAHPKPVEFQTEQSKQFLGGAHHPWRRFFARTVDLLSIALLTPFFLLFFITSLFPDWSASLLKIFSNPIFGGVLLYIFWMPIEAAFLTFWGATPSKWIFGIRVARKTGEKLSYSDALKRTLSVWIQGDGFGIPFVSLFTRFFAYRHLTKTGTTVWDDNVKSVVSHKKWGIMRGLACFTSVLAVLMIMVLLKNL